MAVTLELTATKESAHSMSITSVAYSPDGTKIVSGSLDKTIKVWDAGALAQKTPFVTFSALTLLGLLTDTLDSKGEISDTGMGQVFSVSFSPDGSRIVGGGHASDVHSGTINVWDAGAFWGPKCQFFCLS